MNAPLFDRAGAQPCAAGYRIDPVINAVTTRSLAGGTQRQAEMPSKQTWASAHRGKWGQLTPWING